MELFRQTGDSLNDKLDIEARKTFLPIKNTICLHGDRGISLAHHCVVLSLKDVITLEGNAFFVWHCSFTIVECLSIS